MTRLFADSKYVSLPCLLLGNQILLDSVTMALIETLFFVTPTPIKNVVVFCIVYSCYDSCLRLHPLLQKLTWVCLTQGVLLERDMIV